MFDFSTIITRFFTHIILVMILCYTTYHIIQGNYGLISAQKINKEIVERQAVLANLRQKSSILEKRIEMIRGPDYDWDYIDELARKYFGLSGVNEEVIILQYK